MKDHDFTASEIFLFNINYTDPLKDGFVTFAIAYNIVCPTVVGYINYWQRGRGKGKRSVDSLPDGKRS